MHTEQQSFVFLHLSLARVYSHQPVDVVPVYFFFHVSCYYVDCEGCKAFIEEYYHMRLHDIRIQRDDMVMQAANRSFSTADLELNFCTGRWPGVTSYSKWRRWLYISCVKIAAEKHQQILPWINQPHGLDTYNKVTELYHHIRAKCHEHCNCTAPVVESKPKDECEACTYLSNDLAMVADREKVVDDLSIQRIMDNICEDVPLRHEKYLAVQEFCTEMYDEYQGRVAREMIRIWNDDNINIWVKKDELKKSMCDNIARVCKKKKEEL